MRSILSAISTIFIFNIKASWCFKNIKRKALWIFFISLKIDYVDENGEAAQDAHALVYDAARGHILDNLRGKGAILIDVGDRVDNRTAMRPFYEELFPKATNIAIRSVHEAQLAA